MSNISTLNISVIIPTLNRYNSLKQTLDIVEKSTVKPDEIIVVDQSTDISIVDQVERYCNNSSLNIVYIHLTEPSSTRARNIGIEKSKGEILVFMDDDVDVKPDTFLLLLNIFENKKVSLIAGINEGDKNENSWKGYIFGKASYLKRHFGHVTKSIYGRYPNTTRQKVTTVWAMGFFFAIRKGHLQQMDGLKFDEKLKHYAYAEDLDFTLSYCRNARDKGFECYVCPEISVVHNVSKEYRIPSKKITFIKTLHRIYISNKHFKS